MNTCMHSLTRFLPWFSDSILRWKTLGKTEAEWWQDTFFSSSPPKIHSKLVESFPVAPGSWSFLCDPFHKAKDFTFEGLKGWYTAKLDWLMVTQKWNILNYGVEETLHLSDHKLIWMDIELKK